MTNQRQGVGREKKRPLTDAERIERFKDMAVEIGANESMGAFEDAFAKVVTPPKSKD